MSNQAQCSHSKVLRETIQHPGGFNSDRWICPDCQTNFWPQGTDMHRMKRRHDFAVASLSALTKEGIISSAIPSLAAATDRDAEWRKTMIQAVAKSAFDIADAMIAEEDKR